MSHPNSPSPWGAPGQGQQPGGQHPGQPGGQPGGPQPGVPQSGGPQPGGPQYPGTEQPGGQPPGAGQYGQSAPGQGQSVPGQPGGQHPGQPNLGQQTPGQVQQGSGSPWGASGSGPQHGGAWPAQGSAPQQPGYGSAPAHPGQQNQVPGGQGQFNQGAGGQPGYGSAPGQPSYGSAPQQPGYGSAPQPVGGFGGANAGMPMPENVGKKAKKLKQPKAPGAGLIGPLTLRDILLLVAGLFALVALATPGYVVRVQGVSTGAEWFVQRWAASTIGYVVLGVLPILIAAVLTLVNKLTGSIRLIGSLSVDQLISVLCAVALAMNVVWLVTMVMQFHVGAVFGVLASIIGFLAGTLTVIPAFGKEFAHRPAVDAHPKARPYTKSGAAPAAQGAPGQRAQGPVVENHGGQGAQPAGGYGSQPGSQFAPGQGGPGSQPGSQFAPGQGGPGSQPGSQFAPGQGGPGSQPGSQFAPGQGSQPAAGGHESASQPGSAQGQPWAVPSGQSVTAGGSAAHGTGAPQNEQQDQHGKHGAQDHQDPSQQGPIGKSQHGQGQHDHGQHGEAQKSEDTFHTSDDEQTYLGRHSAQEPRYAQNQPTQAFVTGGKENQASEQPGGPWAQGASAAGSAAGEPQNAGTSQKADGPKKSDEPQKAESAQEPNWAQGAGDVNGSGQTTSAAEPNQADESRGNSGAGATGVAAGVAGAGVAAGPAGATSANAGGTTGTGASQSQSPWAKPDAVTDVGSESAVKDTSEAGSNAQGDSPREPDARGDAEAGVVDDNEPTQYFRPYEYSEQGFEPANEGANGVAGEQVASADQETQLSQAVQPQQETAEQAQPESSEAFWFAVPDPRPAVDETSGETVFMVTPGEWFLAVQNRGTSFVVHNSEQEEGVLHNVSDVILP